METHELTAHPAFPPSRISRVEARIIGRDANWLRLRWRVEGSAELVVPPIAGRGRADELWQTTCFELFLMPQGYDSYCEFNFSPSERWAAYDFESYREGMVERAMPREPDCTMRQGSSFAIFDVAIPVDGLPDEACSMSLTCVLEEEGGAKSFWALSHARSQPDFHDAACFAAHLPAPSAA